MASSQKPVYNAPTSQPSLESADHLHGQTRSRDEIWPFGLTECLLGLWSDSSHLQTSADVANQCLGFVAKFLWHTQHSCHFSLRITLSPQSYNTHQSLLYQITRYDALKEWQKMQNDLTRNTGSIGWSMCKADFTQSGSNLGDLHSWWRHQMETFSALLAFCAGNSPVAGEFPAQRPVTWSFDVFFDLSLKQQLSKQ